MQCALTPTERPLNHTAIERKIREFVAQNLLFSEGDFPYPDDASFLKEGVIDSLGVLELANFVSREFGLQVEMNEVTPQNFDSVNRLASYIRAKLSARTDADVAGS